MNGDGASPPNVIENLLARNRAWAQARTRTQADFFRKSAAGQTPRLYWLGCCDSRVVPTEILDLALGDLFIQTNIANQFRPDDVNAVSSLEYAVRVLQVEHVVVCGHTHCGGILTAMQGAAGAPAAVRDWLAPVRALYAAHQDDLPQDDPLWAQRMLSRLNVERQAAAIADLPSIRNLWRQGQGPDIHGWLYGLEEGIIQEVCRRTRPAPAA